MSRRYALLLDAGFLKYRIGSAKVPMDGPAVEKFVEQVRKIPELADLILHRVYFYDSRPLEGVAKNPFDGSTIDFGASQTAARNKSMHSQLGRAPFFSMRFGELHQSGWELKKKSLTKANK